MSNIQRPLYARFFIGIIVRRDRDLSFSTVYPRTLYARFIVVYFTVFCMDRVYPTTFCIMSSLTSYSL